MHVAVRVDQAGKQRAAAAVDRLSRDRASDQLGLLEHLLTLPVVADQQAVKCWSLPSAPTWMPLTLLTSVSAKAGEDSSAAASARRSLRMARRIALFAPQVKG